METITTRQLFYLLFGFLLGTSIILTTGVEFAAQDTWIAEIIAVMAGLYLAFIISKLYTLSDETNISFVTLLKKIYGNFFGTLVAIIYFFFSLVLCSLVVRNIGDLMTSAIHPETPIEIFIVSITLVSAFGIRKGIEPLSRSLEFLIPLIIALIILLLALLFFNINIDFLKPAFSLDFPSLFKASLVSIAFPIAESVVFLFFLPYLNVPNKAGNGLILAMVAAGILLILRPVVTVGVFGAEESTKTMFSLFAAVRMIDLADFIQRLEVIMLFVWVTTTFVKICVIHFVCTVSLAETLKINDYKILAYPLGLIIAPLSILMYENFSQELLVAQRLWPILAIPLGFILPTITLLIGFVRKIRQLL